ncbi:ImmA/IrrE family metallo-endopeptidase [Levilactobacillus cerevisiae]|uniref:ImmA/IrrE family metallo-endopeptidase n=1 Tax=Levilactobacillus cerevisiae TaxID=1704076 RepID=UPI0013DE06ED|nr:ImmA/IrrE family metallo-endopeptidase [Levilactobacillus cerevisiae]
MLKFKKIYSKSFIRQFGNQANQFSEMSALSDSPYIDLRKISKLIGMGIIYDSLSEHNSGTDSWCNGNVHVNQRVSETKNRFTIAHEIGHELFGHHNLVCRPNYLASYQKVLEKSREMTANTFAETLLMPRILLVKLASGIIRKNQFDAAGLTAQQVSMITDTISEELVLSRKMVKYRFQNVRIFVNQQ